MADNLGKENSSREQVDEAEAILQDSNRDKTNVARGNRELTKDLDTNADFRPDAQYLLSEAKTAVPSTEPERALERERESMLANNSLTMEDSGDEVERYKRSEDESGK